MILRCCFLSKVLVRLPSLCVILLPHPIKAQLVPLPGTNTGEPRSHERSKSVLGRLVSISFLLVRTWRKKGWRWTIFVFCVVPLRSLCYMRFCLSSCLSSVLLLQHEFGSATYDRIFILGLVFCVYWLSFSYSLYLVLDAY